MEKKSFLSFENYHCLITGASGGIGLCLAEKYLENGCNLTLHYNKNIDPLNNLLKKFPEKTIALSADAKNEISIQNLFEKSIEKFGPINILIANHGIEEPVDVPIWEMTLDQWKNTIDINLTGIFLFCREFLRNLKKSLNLNFKNPNIVVIGSTAGLFGEAFHVDYSSSKSALSGFIKSLKNEIVKLTTKARINCVAPGWVHTPLASIAIQNGDHYKALQTTALKKIAKTDDVANAVLFLSSEAAGHITGTILEVHGGMEGRVLNSLDEIKQ